MSKNEPGFKHMAWLLSRPLHARAGRDPKRGNQNENKNQPNFLKCGYQQNQMIKSLPLRLAQDQAFAHTLVHILTQMQQLMQRPQYKPISADKFVMLSQKHLDGPILSIARNL